MIEGQLPLPMADDGVGAVFSPCRRYRYRLWRTWSNGPILNALMLNPSTATEVVNDPTVAKMQKAARAWGYGTLEVTNIFAWRATDPEELYQLADPVGEDNDAAILESASAADLVVVAWGNHGAYRGRGTEVLGLLRSRGIALHALTTTGKGQPGHPLYLKGSTRPQPFNPDLLI